MGVRQGLLPGDHRQSDSCEIRKGIERLRPKDPLQAAIIERWLDTLRQDFGDNVLPFTDDVADCWGRITAKTPLAVSDSLIAATALTHGLTVATCNEATSSCAAFL